MRYFICFILPSLLLGFIFFSELSCSNESPLLESESAESQKTSRETASSLSTEPTPLPSHAKQSSGEASLNLEILSTDVANSFEVYVGGGTNIRPPKPIGGSGIPMFSGSKNDDGSSTHFMAGTIRAIKETDRLIKVTCKIENKLHKPQFFKVGDIAFHMDSTTVKDFSAVALGKIPCSMSDTDLAVVKAKAIEVDPNGYVIITYVFALPDSSSKKGAFALGNSKPVAFEIDKAGD